MSRAKVPCLIAATIALSCGAGAQSDFDRYVEDMRKSGMSERASGDLSQVAGILSGDTIFEATRTAGGVTRSYSAAICFRPTTDEKVRDEQRALRATWEAKRDRWMPFLKKQADTDGSGFVTTEEAFAIRRRVETALIAAQISVSGADELSEALSQDSQEVVADLAAYSRMMSEATKEGYEGMPALPSDLGRNAQSSRAVQQPDEPDDAQRSQR